MDHKGNRLTPAKNYPCVVCNKRTKQNDRRNLNGPDNKQIRKYLYKNYMINIKEEDVICGKCRIKCHKSIHHNASTSESVSRTKPDESDYMPPIKRSKESLKSPKHISLPLTSVKGSSHSQCCICKRRGQKMVVVPPVVRYNTLIDRNIIIPSGSRCCPGHIENDSFTEIACSKMSDLNSETDFNRTEICKIIQNVRDIALKNKCKRIDFDTSAGMTDTDYYNLMGLSKEHFDDICSHVKDIRDTKVRSQRTCIGILLTKLRSGMSNKLLSTIFNVSVASIKRSVASARKELSTYFTPNYIGFQHINRNTVIQEHTRQLAKTLFGGPHNPAILVLDGTYIYIQKSSQFRFQRRCYSLHKNRPLVKPMMVVTTTGYIVSALGPYFSDSKNNDANILKHSILSNLENMSEWLTEDDVLVVDRGFRDSIDLLNDLGIKTEMPVYLQKGQKQHTVQDSNASRLVTKIRWVVESVNSRVKAWKFLSNIVPNSQIPYIGDYVRLISAMCNKYFRPLSSTTPDDELLGYKMLHLCKQNNDLKDKVIEQSLDTKKSAWKQITSLEGEFDDFPRLDEDDLRTLTLGVYQVKLAKSYTKEHLNEEGGYDLFVCKQDEHLLMGKIQSRHVSSKTYKLWIEYDIIVKGWYCQCRAGARVVGSCAHIASVIWYLGCARFKNIEFNKSVDWSVFLSDAKDIPEPQLVDNDDEDAEDTEE